MSNAPTQAVHVDHVRVGRDIAEVTVTATRDLGRDSPSAGTKVVVPIPVGNPARRSADQAEAYALEEARSLLEILANDVQREAQE